MKKRYQESIALAKEAGGFLKKSAKFPTIFQEFPYDIKLIQDQDSEKLILNGIEKHFSCDGYISEEKGNKESSSGYLWIIDPLDGTFNYYRGIPQCCVSIACLNGDKGFGVVYDFFRDEIFQAFTGEGAFLNGEKIEVSKVQTLKESVLTVGLMKTQKEIKTGTDIFSSLVMDVKKVRIMGAAALDLCYVASGRTDIFVEAGLKEWDVAAGKIIVEEAGGEYQKVPFDGTVLHFAGNNLIQFEELNKKA
jgi:myo-inositol-1(or 4)-monophosphatase